MHSGRDTRGLGCAAAAVVVMARGVAGGSLSFSRASGSLLVARAGSVWVLPRFFSRSVQIPDARGRSGRSSTGRAGVVRRNGATKTRGVYYFCLLRGGDLDFSLSAWCLVPRARRRCFRRRCYASARGARGAQGGVLARGAARWLRLLLRWRVRCDSLDVGRACRGRGRAGPTYTPEVLCCVTWFFTWPNFVGLLVGIGSGTLFTTAGAASAATRPPPHEDAVKRAHGSR